MASVESMRFCELMMPELPTVMPFGLMRSAMFSPVWFSVPKSSDRLVPVTRFSMA